MKRIVAFLLLTAAIAVARAEPQQKDVWATAIAERPSDGRRVIFRYVKEFGHSIERSAFPYAIVLAWRFASETGMPQGVAVDAMYELEDRLSARVESSGLGRLVLISTGENVRLWTYYVKSDIEFRAALEAALVPASKFPVEVSSKHDPTWTEYERFKRGVREK